MQPPREDHGRRVGRQSRPPQRRRAQRTRAPRGADITFKGRRRNDSTPASGPAAAPASPDRPLPGVPSVSHRFLLNDFAKISATRDAFLLFYDECTGT